MGDKEAKNEFNELFDDLIVDVCESTAKYSDIVKQLEALLELEKETLVIKRKVSTFSLDYDDDLVIVHTIKSVMIKNMKISNLHVTNKYRQIWTAMDNPITRRRYKVVAEQYCKISPLICMVFFIF